MASVIEKVSFNNFFNYYGDFEKNEYEFSKGLNIVIADNGHGKSKFFNAFLWFFYDEVLDSDKKIRVPIKSFAIKMISDKAKAETEIGHSVDCGIRINYSDSRNSYQITKSITAKRIGNSNTKSSDWQVYVNDTSVAKKDLILLNYHPVYDENERIAVLDKLIQRKLRPYSLFQGEEVDKLIDFSKPAAIREAVTTLTNIKSYEKLQEKTAYIYRRAEESLNRVIQSSSEDTIQFERITTAIADEREKLEIEEEKLKRFQLSFDENKQEVDDLEKANQNAEKRKIIDDKLKDLNRDLKQAKTDYEDLTSKITSRFFDGSFAWMAHGCRNFVDAFQLKINTFSERRTAYKLEKLNADNGARISLLPADSPDVVTLRTMIDKEFCYICNREALKGTAAHDHLLSLLERPNKKADADIFKNDFAQFFSDIQLGAQPFLSRINEVRNSVQQTRLKEAEQNDKIKKLQARIKDQKDKRSLLILGDEETDITDATAIMNQYKGAISRMERAKLDLETCQERINRIAKQIRLLEDERGRMDVKDVPEAYGINNTYALDLKNAAERTRARVYEDMLGNLQHHANRHFQSLIKYNDLKGGTLKFIKTPTDTIEFRYVDKDDNEVTGASEGFQRMKVLSVLMAIISVNKTGYQYPLVADAPLSAFGQGFIKGFFEETSKVFPQSIILIKELYDKDRQNKLNALGLELLNNDGIQTIYLNEIPENLIQTEIYTLKSKIK